MVGNRHRLTEHLVGRIPDRDVVAEGLGHLVGPIGSDEERHRHDRLRGLTRPFLEITPHEQVEQLVGAADLDVGLDGNRVGPLQQRVHELDQRYRFLIAPSTGEVLPVHQTRHGDLGRHLEHICHVHRTEPFRVATNLEVVVEQQGAHHGQTCIDVSIDFLVREALARGVLAGGVAHLCGEVSEDEDGQVPLLLESAEQIEHDGPAEGDVRCRRVDAEFDAQRPAKLELTKQLTFGKCHVDGLRDRSQLLGRCSHVVRG